MPVKISQEIDFLILDEKEKDAYSFWLYYYPFVLKIAERHNSARVKAVKILNSHATEIVNLRIFCQIYFWPAEYDKYQDSAQYWMYCKKPNSMIYIYVHM